MKMTKKELRQIIKEELKGVLSESYTSTQTELSDIDREMQAMPALDQAILAKVDAAGAKYLKRNEKEQTPYERMADADIRVLHLHAKRTVDGANNSTIEDIDPSARTRAFQEFTAIDREYAKRKLS